MNQIGVAKALQGRAIHHQTVTGRQFRQDPLVGAAGHRHAAEFGDVEQVAKGLGKRTSTRTAGQHERTVDIEKEDQPSLRTFPALGPFADGSSSKLTRCPSFSWSKLP
jgi:hypothetical protein